MLTDTDTNGDTFKDKYEGVRTGTPVCWKVVSKPNTTVPATQVPQLYRATITVYGDGITQLDQRDVFFLVPLDGPLQYDGFGRDRSRLPAPGRYVAIPCPRRPPRRLR